MSFMNAFFSKLGWAREPDKRDYYLFLIESLRRDNNHTDVIKTATKALGVYPNDAKFYQLRGLSYYELFQHYDAILDFKFVHALDPNNDVIYHHLLDALNSATLYKEAILLADEAIAKYQEALRKKPAYKDALTLEAGAAEKFQEANPEHKHLAFYPKNFYRSRAFSYYMLGDPEKAFADFKCAIGLEPGNYDLYLELLQPAAAGVAKNPALAQKAAELIVAYADKAMRDYAVRSGLLDLKTGAEHVLKDAQRAMAEASVKNRPT